MNTLSVRVRYRPLRIGWCVRDGDWEQLRLALELTHTLWGGRFNPIIPLGNDTAASELIEAFRVDALFSADENAGALQLADRFSWLRWPFFARGIFVEGEDGPVPTLLDVYHPVRQIFEEFIERANQTHVKKTFLPVWEASDPLAPVFLASFGAYPSPSELHRYYADNVTSSLKATTARIQPSDGVPRLLLGSGNPSEITRYLLTWDRAPHHRNPGFYVGDSNDFQDVVNFWNLRASDIGLYFFDPKYSERLQEFCDAYVALLQGPPRPTQLDRVAIWSRDGRASNPPGSADFMGMPSIDGSLWKSLGPPLHYIDRDQSVLASVSDGGQAPPTMSLQLPKKPFEEDDEIVAANQHVVVSLTCLSDLPGDAPATFQTPFIQKLNDFYRQQKWLIGDDARVETTGLGVVTSCSAESLTIRSVPKRDLIRAIFGCFRMMAESSEPGRIATRLIRQMGGIQGCRVFKIRGVRKLIEKYGPLQSFTRSEAVRMIGENDPETGVPNFAAYENLYIEPRETPLLKPEQAFQFLLKKGVFQTGLKLVCPNCELDFWLPLADVSSNVACQYCGSDFNVTPQLKDRDWAYRRSGLFGRENNQEGSIPVVLTVQQLDTILRSRPIFDMATKIKSIDTDVETCETDFVCVHQEVYDSAVSIAIGECKTRQEISQQDVTNLTRVADAFQANGVKPYVVFSKLSSFSQEEIERCRHAQRSMSPRVIMLSDRELEPYRAYERLETAGKVGMPATSLEAMARFTRHLYLR